MPESAGEGAAVPGHVRVLDRYFDLRRNGTEPRTEIVAGVTTFLTMAYIVFVNPQILGTTGMDKGAVFVATCIAAAASTLVMGLYANYPIALAPGMGLNAFFAFTIVVTYKYSWQQGLAAVFCSGVLFLLISVSGVRQYVIDSIPHNLKLAVSAGVGLFLGIIALETSGIIAAHPVTLVTLGDLTKPAPILALFGFVLIAALNYRGITGATLLGILAVTLIGLPLGLTHYAGVVSMPPSLAPTLFKLDFSGAAELTFVVIVFSILFVDVFDNAGTLIGVTHRTGLMRDGKLARMKEALISDSFAAIFGSLIGTSTTTSYIESAAGVAAGGRTGLTAVVVAICFLLALFFSPLAGMIPAYASAAALLYVACLMARGLAEIEWDDVTESAPAVIAAVTMPLTYSIATGIGLGFITYVLAKLIAGRFSQVSPAAIVLALLFAAKFAISGDLGVTQPFGLRPSRPPNLAVRVPVTMMSAYGVARTRAGGTQFETGNTHRDVEPGLALEAQRLQRERVGRAADQGIRIPADADGRPCRDARIIPGQIAGTDVARGREHGPAQAGLLREADIETDAPHQAVIRVSRPAVGLEPALHRVHRADEEARARGAPALKNAGLDARLARCRRAGCCDRGTCECADHGEAFHGFLGSFGWQDWGVSGSTGEIITVNAAPARQAAGGPKRRGPL